MSESIAGTTFIAEWVNDGVGVKITVKNIELKNLNDSKKSIISMVSALFKKLEEQDSSDKPGDKKSCDKKPSIDTVHSSSNKVRMTSNKKKITSNKEKITSDVFIQACISCLNDKENISELDICNPTFNTYLPKSYCVIQDEDKSILDFDKKKDLMRADSRIVYDESKNLLTLKK